MTRNTTTNVTRNTANILPQILTRLRFSGFSSGQENMIKEYIAYLYNGSSCARGVFNQLVDLDKDLSEIALS